MSKGSLLFGTGSGKLGSFVMSRTKGQERHRAYIAKVKNPRSFSQMVTRIGFSTAGLAYKGLKDVSQKLSFKGFGANSYNSFIKSNLSLAPFYSKEVIDEMSSKSLFPIAPWIISNGSLVPPSFLSSISFIDTPTYHGYEIQVNVSADDMLEFWTEGLGLIAGVSEIENPSLFLRILWHFLGIPETLHLCLLIGSISQYDVSSFPSSLSSVDINKLSFCELFPFSSSVVSHWGDFFGVSVDGALEILERDAIPIVGLPVDYPQGEFFSFISFYSTFNHINGINKLHLRILKYKGDTSSLYTADRLLYSVWVADSIKRSTSFASLSWIDTPVTTAYQNSISEQRKKEVVPTWVDTSSLNSSVYTD